MSLVSDRNLELVRRFWASVETKRLDELDDLLDVAYEWDCAAESPGIQVHRGREKVKAFIEGWPKGWDEYRITSDELIELDRRILQLVHLNALRTGDRGSRLDQPCALLHTLAEGKLRKTEAYWHRSDALEAVGLSS